jgi:glucose/arabinose dehydrogenase
VYLTTHSINLANFALRQEQKGEAIIDTKPTDVQVSDEIQIVAQNLDTPWGIAFLPNGGMLVTERKGTVQMIANGTTTLIAQISSSKEIGEGGLLGIALHPNFSDNSYVYLYYTYNQNGANTENRVVRMTYQDGALVNEKTIVDAIPGASNHNGGRILFGPDDYLYVGTGDAQEPSKSQDTKSLAGKILRVRDDGSIPSDNPYGNAVYSYGHRNVQGLAWDATGQLWATEHGRSGLQSGLDEVNKIEKGKNYGWPDIQGDESKSGMERPFLQSGDKTWAPGGMDYTNGNLYFVGLRGAAVYHFSVTGGASTMHEHFTNEYGRLRDIHIGKDGFAYITTSNNDGRGVAKEGDDKILKIKASLL